MAEQEQRRCRVRHDRQGEVTYDYGFLITIGPSVFQGDGGLMQTTSAFVELMDGRIIEVEPHTVEVEPRPKEAKA